MLNYLAFRHYKRWDWTEESLFTLSDRSERVLAELEQPVEVWVMVGENEPEHAELRTLVSLVRRLQLVPKSCAPSDTTTLTLMMPCSSLSPAIA